MDIKYYKDAIDFLTHTGKYLKRRNNCDMVVIMMI
jgi:hypothetical protein